MRKGERKPARKDFRVTVRFSVKEWNRVRILARLYARGNVAKWIRHGALEAERRHLR